MCVVAFSTVRQSVGASGSVVTMAVDRLIPLTMEKLKSWLTSEEQDDSVPAPQHSQTDARDEALSGCIPVALAL